ncbi:Uncharacterised protein g1741 [Pycnogonum litorale]
MYKNMKTNLPKEVMPFPGFPFTGCSESFLHHTQIQEYLVNFANHYSIEKHIKFDRKVIEVRPEVDQGHVKWIVKIMDVNSKQINTRKFDSVMVCIGNYSKPHVPEIPGINSFSGEIIHSHYYDDNTPYKDKTVVCLGRGPSGIDMSLEISKVAKKVYLSHNKQKLVSPLPSNMVQVSGIDSIDDTEIRLKDELVINADVIILCTGYNFNYSFLHPDCKVLISNHRVTPLYKHLINIEHPTLCLCGILLVICPFPMFDIQIRFFLQHLEKQINLPSKEDMYKDQELDLKKRRELGLEERHAHLMGPRQWIYHDELAHLGNFEHMVPEVVRDIYNYVHETRVKDVINYKKLKYVVNDDGTFSVI